MLPVRTSVTGSLSTEMKSPLRALVCLSRSIGIQNYHYDPCCLVKRHSAEAYCLDFLDFPQRSFIPPAARGQNDAVGHESSKAVTHLSFMHLS